MSEKEVSTCSCFECLPNESADRGDEPRKRMEIADDPSHEVARDNLYGKETPNGGTFR